MDDDLVDFELLIVADDSQVGVQTSREESVRLAWLDGEKQTYRTHMYSLFDTERESAR